MPTLLSRSQTLSREHHYHYCTNAETEAGLRNTPSWMWRCQAPHPKSGTWINYCSLLSLGENNKEPQKHKVRSSLGCKKLLEEETTGVSFSGWLRINQVGGGWSFWQGKAAGSKELVDWAKRDVTLQQRSWRNRQDYIRRVLRRRRGASPGLSPNTCVHGPCNLLDSCKSFAQHLGPSRCPIILLPTVDFCVHLYLLSLPSWSLAVVALYLLPQATKAQLGRTRVDPRYQTVLSRVSFAIIFHLGSFQCFLCKFW